MSIENNEKVIVERAKLRPAITAEMVEFTGRPIDFIWTDRVFFGSNKFWHELKVIGENTLFYAAIPPWGGALVVNELDEINQY